MNQTAAPPASPRLSPSITASRGRLQWRHFKDVSAKWIVGVGGLSVLVALLLIFVYLLVEVLPLFRGADVHPRAAYAVPGGAGRTLYLATEEQFEVGLRVTPDGAATFFDVQTGAVRETLPLPLNGRGLARVAEVALDKGYLAAALDDGSVLPFKHTYAVTYPGDRRRIQPAIEFPRGPKPIAFMPEAPRALAVRDSDERLFLAGADRSGRVYIKTLETTASLFGESSTRIAADLAFTPAVTPDFLLVDPGIAWLYTVDARRGRIALHELRGGEPPLLVSDEAVGGKVAYAGWLAGGISVLTADERGRVVQWFPARDADGNWQLARVREFETGGPPTALAAEHRRRGFAVGDAQGNVALLHATAQRTVLEERLLDGPVEFLSFDPRANGLLALGRDGMLHAFRVDNEHPEVSWSSLWGRVWYESYDTPDLLWQSSSAVGDFEPKFSLTPLTLGTLKGAFYAMIFAVPLAVLGAMFTAYFMSPALRQVVKPTVEVMQALPTVILGFLAGLWLAPFVEANLPGMFLTLVVLPVAVPAVGYLWLRMPPRVRRTVPTGWEAALLMPVLVLLGWACFALAQPAEALLFGGNMQSWLDEELGIGYDQRNCLVVGIAMGIAVIPGIFSIAEDAIFSVPRHLSLGSLALGATPWQTLVGVVLPTASPGIFSAIMIGLGRAVGETMIVLMATGNTPVMDFGMFSGMRTLSANVAVEMPESEVGSTHVRLLFLAGLVLFLLTFFLNTLAEVVRQRLREKYSNL
ncbi:MAG: ABC transporter permease subunit [Gammaproteobacteria bacterium]|nr:ABC transporter permease subunit [Gammaproteobacteria bacterium]